MTEAEMLEDLSAADAAGDTELAQAIAGRIKASRAPMEQVHAPSDVAALSSHDGRQTRASLTPGEKAINIIGRGAWALPGLVGLDWEKANELSGGRSAKEERAVSAQTDSENPILSGIGRGLAAAPGEALAWTTLPGAKAAQGYRAVAPELAQLGRTFWQKALEYGPKLGLTAAASEAGSTGYKNPLDRLKGAAAAGATATVLGGAGAGVLPNPAVLTPRPGTFQEAAKGPRVEITPEARLLQQEGVEGLTTGQLAGQKSIIGRFEGASSSAPGGLYGEREIPQLSYQRVVQDKGLAPGASRPVTANLEQRLKEIHKGFDPAYDQVRGVSFPGGDLADMPGAALRPVEGIDQATREGARREVANAMTVLRGVKSNGTQVEAPGLTPEVPIAVTRRLSEARASDKAGVVEPNLEVPEFNHMGDRVEPVPNPPWSAPRERTQIPVKGDKPRLTPGTTRPQPNSGWSPAFEEPEKYTIGDLIKVRENIRASQREAVNEPDRLRQLNHAEDVVTEAIQSHLSPELQKHLQETDRQYARHMTSYAAPQGQTEFTPIQHLRKLEQQAGRRRFKHGDAGDMQDLSQAAREVFTEPPRTGFVQTIVKAPVVRYMPGLVSRAANTDAAKAFLFQPRSSASYIPRPSAATVGALGATGIPDQTELFIQALRGGRDPQQNQ